MRGVIDRIVQSIITAEMEGKQMQEFMAEKFPPEAREGDVFELGEDGSVELLPEERERRRKAARAMFDRLKKRAEEKSRMEEEM